MKNIVIGRSVIRGEKLHDTPAAQNYLEERGFYVHPETLRVWRSKGKGPEFIKCGSRVYYPQSALDHYLYDHDLHQTTREYA